ncbi:LysM peptidoglycan-binding domain-containing protein [Candidatus Peregrinibacteria bacterium]|jgi:hypothetical protein|nr:LysM peptidoglycan-binding domain-containing protein [Candidatus Peregrinibacteria bacterium]
MKFSSILRKILLSGLTLALFFVFSGLSYASLAIQPARESINPDANDYWFVLELDPGETVDLAAMVKNLDPKSASVTVDAVDAFSGGENVNIFSLAASVEEKKGVGKWIEMDEEYKELDMKAKEDIKVPFTLTVPENVAPGMYFGAITVTSAPSNFVGGAGAIILSRMGARIYLKITGEEIVDFKMNSFDYQLGDRSVDLTYVFQNDGNIYVGGDIDVTANSVLFGEDVVLDTFEFNIPPSGGENTVLQNWADIRYGIYKLDIGIKAYTKNIVGPRGDEILSTRKQITVIHLPWLYIALAAGFILLLIFFLLWKRHRLHALKASMVSYKAKKGDTIYELAAKYGIKWKLLAKLNKVKAPYMLLPGQVIVVPKKKK